MNNPANVFANTAPAYLNRGVPVIPLAPCDKRPIPVGWQVFSDRMPTPDEVAFWYNQYPNGNIGIVLGGQSKVVIVDIDTLDERIANIIESCLPPSPWERIGKKGKALAYRFNGQKTFRVKTANGDQILDFLSSKTQLVLPPSIHPDTRQPYMANCDLLDVIDELPALDPQIEMIIRGALGDAGVELSHSGWTRVTDFVSAGGRDNQLASMAGIFAQGITRGEISLLTAFDRMDAWIDNLVEKVDGDEVSKDKGRDRILNFLVKDVLGEKKKALPKGWDDGFSEEDKKNLGIQFGVDNEQWDYEKLANYLTAQFEVHDPGSTGRMSAVEYILQRIAASPSLGSMDEDRILKWIVDSSQLKLQMSTLRKRMRELRAGAIEGLNHTEVAEEVIKDMEQFGGIRFHNGRFWQWKGSDWQVKEEAEILAYIADEYGHLQAVRRHSDHNGILKVMANLRSMDLKTKDINGINFTNGVLTKDLQLIPHSPEFGFTYTLPFGYRPEANGKHFRFMELLYNSWGHEDDYQQKLEAMREVICVTLFGFGPKFSRAACLYGLPKSGKTQVLNVVKGLVPEGSWSAIPPTDWGDKFLKTELHDKLLNLGGDLSENKMIDGEMFKQIIDGSTIPGQRKNQPIFHFSPRCMHCFASNHLPRTRDTSDGFNRRWLILSFMRPVKDADKVLDLGNVIVAEEREAIVAWAVEIVQQLLAKREYTLPPSHFRMLGEMANLNNSVRFFLTTSAKIRIPLGIDELEKADISDPTLSRISETKLHTDYWSFCVGTGGAQPVGLRSFRAKMRELGNELGFKMRITTTQQGLETVEYVNLTYADAKAG